MFEIGDVVEYIGDSMASIKADEVMSGWFEPRTKTNFFIVESIQLATIDDCRLRVGYKIYKVYIRYLQIYTSSHGIDYVQHNTDMFWDFELRKVYET